VREIEVGIRVARAEALEALGFPAYLSCLPLAPVGFWEGEVRPALSDDLPRHLMIPVDANGDGPLDMSSPDVDRWECWCGVLGCEEAPEAWQRKYLITDAARRAERHIGRTRIARCYVSTVWLGLDHSFDDGPPLIFETMIFVPRLKDRSRPSSPDCWTERYSTQDQARLGHERVVNRLRSRGFAGISTWEAT
jgi:hypothetical protein